MDQLVQPPNNWWEVELDGVPRTIQTTWWEQANQIHITVAYTGSPPTYGTIAFPNQSPLLRNVGGSMCNPWDPQDIVFPP